jgi:hypothetical protein
VSFSHRLANCARGALPDRDRSKRRDQPYQAGRSKHWVKIKNRKHPAVIRVMEAFA